MSASEASRSTRPVISRAATATVVVLNCGWVLASAVVAIVGPWSLTALGTAFVVAQVLVVAGFAALQFARLRQLRGASREDSMSRSTA